ncbi:uncharacterized protein LOC144822215 isoform X3 [Lissotriton helveticus]
MRRAAEENRARIDMHRALITPEEALKHLRQAFPEFKVLTLPPRALPQAACTGFDTGIHRSAQASSGNNSSSPSNRPLFACSFLLNLTYIPSQSDK